MAALYRKFLRLRDVCKSLSQIHVARLVASVGVVMENLQKEKTREGRKWPTRKAEQ